MTESPSPEAATGSTAPAARKEKREPASVIIRPWPKVVFLYPIFLVSTAFWLISVLGGTPANAALPTNVPWMGNVFVLVTFLNFLVFAFDFSRIKSITILFGVVAAGFALVQFDVLDWLNSAIGEIDIQMNSWFYGTFSVMMGAILLLVLINTRFNYYEVNHREILHHHGYLGDVTRMPTTGLRLNKEIYDLMEYLLLRSGRLIFYPSTSREAIVIDNVLNVNRIEDRIKDLLSVVAVRMTEHHDDPE